MDVDAHHGTARFRIVGIGASAGGLRALQRFFDHLPVDAGMAYVVIVHLDPDHQSQMAELLQRHSGMPVKQVTRQLKVEPNRVYIIPPDRDLSLTDGHFRLSPRSRERGRRAPIDLFFRTLAETHEGDAVGIVLSGTGSDGTQGIRWIREHGGVTMAQAPDEAEYGEMPRSAIATGQVDVVLPVAELAPEAVRLGGPNRLQPSAADGHDAEANEAPVRRILTFIRAKSGHDFGDYKRSTVLRRLARRMHVRRVATFPEYLTLLRSDADELRAVFNELLITVTSFFRDPEAFEALEQQVIPKLFADKDREDTVRVWVAGCSTGQEAYSLVILLCEHAAGLDDPPSIQVFATDIHEQSFAFAREGLYSESAVADVSPQRCERFFSTEPGGYRVKKVVREKVLFATHNLLSDPPFRRLDLVSCRNLLIYLQRDAQERAFKLFNYALCPGAHLFLGSAESAETASRLFTVVDRKRRIFRSQLTPPAPVLAGLLPASRELPPPASARTVATPSQSKPIQVGALHHQLVEAYAPPSVLVNTDGEIVHLSDRVGQYLQPGGGEPTKKLLDLVQGELRVRLRILLRRALVKGEPGRELGLRTQVDGKERRVDLIVRPLPEARSGGNVALVIFDEQEESKRPRGAAPREGRAESGRRSTTRLEQELQEAKAALHTIIEEHEAAIEELRASNEEFQSINEEQKATSEELETSKEELQSTNEELLSVNQEQRHKNEELRQLNSDVQNLVDSTDIGTIFVDRELRIRRYTPAVTEVFNIVASDKGRPIAHVTHRLDYHDLVADVRAVLQSLSRVERVVSAADGRWFSLRLSPYRSVDDRIDGVVLTVVDTTGRKRAEVERELLLETAEAASAAKSDFIGVMSHEFRTPLNAIIGYADILIAGAVGPLSAEQSRHLDRITASARHLARIVDDVLSSARSDAGAMTIDREQVDVATAVRDAAAVIEPLAVARKLEFHAEAPDPSTVIVTDATKLRQVLFNLLANAVRFTDQGQVSLRARADEEGVVFEVEDTGIGIPSQHLENIFERFWQADQGKAGQRGGTGLGLSVSRSLARLLGGDLEVKSERGRGSLFTVRLPLHVDGRPQPDQS